MLHAFSLLPATNPAPTSLPAPSTVQQGKVVTLCAMVFSPSYSKNNCDKGQPMTVYDPDVPKTDEEHELEAIVARLAYQLEDAREGSAEYKMIERQMDGIRHGSELGGLLMEEYDIGGLRAVRHWLCW
jgi:hypothetical protein